MPLPYIHYNDIKFSGTDILLHMHIAVVLNISPLIHDLSSCSVHSTQEKGIQLNTHLYSPRLGYMQ